MAAVKFFYDPLSQPSRAVLILLETGNISYQPCLIDFVKVMKGETAEPEFAEANPNKTVPTIKDNDFKLFESTAIMKYLITQYKLPDHWYPSDPQRRAKVDEYLFWHGTGLRKGTTGLFFNKYVSPRISSSAPDERKLQECQPLLKKGLGLLDSHFLKDTKFINSPTISIADLQAACELTQFWMTDIDLLEDKPRVKEWLKNVQSETEPAFSNAHKMVKHAQSQGIFKN